MHLHPALAPIKACILPLSKQLNEQAMALYQDLAAHFSCDYDDAGSIGKRYRRNDAIGTPFCITYDFDSLQDQCVTIRHRDTMLQERCKITEVRTYIEKHLHF
ncbi:Glycine--tRNA ligase [bioreactor metagenome]|uniref:Glycine--tRNA ligase n=1 Tax=bioreactor metagenome TaxID=1076179 RepID=A0A645CWS7_9ZZZZ